MREVAATGASLRLGLLHWIFQQYPFYFAQYSSNTSSRTTRILDSGTLTTITRRKRECLCIRCTHGRTVSKPWELQKRGEGTTCVLVIAETPIAQ